MSLSGCGDVYRYLKSGRVGWALNQELRERGVSRVELVKLTDFEWGELFIFGPYESTSDVCMALALPAFKCKAEVSASTVSDGEELLVFRQRGKIVHQEVHLRWHGDFSPIPEGPLTPQTAIFAVSVQGTVASGADRFVLRQVGGS